MKSVKIILNIIISLALIAIFLIALQIFASTLFFDRYVNSTLQNLSKNIPNLKLEYKPLEKSLFSRDGTIIYEIITNEPFEGKNYIDGKLHLRVDFLPLSIKGNFYSLKDNFTKYLDSLNLKGFKLQGDFSARAFPFKFNFNISHSPMYYPFSQGDCRIGAGIGNINASSLDNIFVYFSNDKIKCLGNKYYNYKESFNLDLQNFSFFLKPQLISNKIVFDTIHIKASQILAGASVIYLLGFDEFDNVKDSSFYDLIKLNNIDLILKVKDLKKQYQGLGVDMSGDINFAIPYIKNNIFYDLTTVNDCKANFEISGINIPNTIKALKSYQSLSVNNLLALINDRLNLKIYNISLGKNNDKLNIRGDISTTIDKTNVKIKDYKIKTDIKISKDYLNSINQDSYLANIKDYIIENFREYKNYYIYNLNINSNKQHERASNIPNT